MRLLVKHIILYFVLLSGFAFSTAQSQDNTGYPVFEITWSNDIFHQTDRNFSNGFDLAFYHRAFEKSPLRFIMLPNKSNDLTWQGLTLTQHFFTPRELFTSEVISEDRPFASYLLLGHKKISSNPKRFVKRSSEFQIGILGRHSGGKTLQNGIHLVLPASEPADGWDNQLKTDLAINYSLRYEKGIANEKLFNIVPYGEAKIGVPYTSAGAGLRAQAGMMNDYFSTMGVTKSDGWQLYAFGDIGGRYVLYNGALQGGLINTSVHTIDKINPWVYTLKAGVVFAVKSFSFEYGSVLLSKEYASGSDHKWGYISLKFAF